MYLRDRLLAHMNMFKVPTRSCSSYKGSNSFMKFNFFPLTMYIPESSITSFGYFITFLHKFVIELSMV